MPYDLDIIAKDVNNNFDHKFTVTQNNKLLVQKVEIQNVPSDIAIEASGNGCAVVQVLLTLTQMYFSYLHKGILLYLNCRYLKKIQKILGRASI